jgi:acyl-CoA synthetase (NDP forming)/GNAT superfamily N-acetyltransferase
MVAMEGVDVLLSDGSTVHVRPITPEDADRVVALHSRFSARTRYLRYFSPYPRIPARDLERFVNVDHRDREALVVAVGDDLIAVGRYERLAPDAPDAEVAFVVEDSYQGRGVGSMLIEHLASAAREAGLETFVAEVLPENSTMLRVFGDAGFQVSREYADGVVHLTFPIAPTTRSVSVQHRREQTTEAASIARLLAPRAVAVYGASRDGRGVGATLLRHVRAAGFTGRVYPIHPSASTVDAVPAYRSAVDAPGPIDLALVAVPADDVAAVVADAGRARAHALVIVSSGFADSGPGQTRGSTPGAHAQQNLVAQARANGMRVVGPNCLGVVNTDPAARLNASLAPILPERGRVGIFCQSAAVGIAALAESNRRHIGLSTFVSVGNRADVSGNDLLQFWRHDPATDVVLLYLETFGNPRKFARIARELASSKPIVAVSAGAGFTPAGAGLTTGPATALYAHSGVIRVATLTEMFDVGQIFASQPMPAGRRVGVVGNAAALVSLATGACASVGLSTSDNYSEGLSLSSSPGRLTAAVSVALADDEVDTVFVVLAPPVPEAGLGRDPAGRDQIAAVAAAAEQPDKPIVVTLVGAAEGVVHASQPVPVFPAVEEAVRALAHVTEYAAWRRQPQGSLLEPSDVDSFGGRRIAVARGPVDELLRAYGIAPVPTRRADTEEQAVGAANALGFPVALKAADPDLRHRLDLGAVRLDLPDAPSVRSAYAEISAQFGAGMLVQPMVAPGVACVVEVVDDPAFGPVVGFGLGGVASDLLGDRAWRVAPLTDRDAVALVHDPAAAAMLFGYRGAPAVDAAALVDLLLRVGRLADETPEVKRLELNPVLVQTDGLAVLHAELSYGPVVPRPDTGPRRLR